MSIGSYMNEPDLMNNKFQLHEAMEEARDVIGQVFDEFGELTGREYGDTDAYKAEDADVLLVLLGSSFHTAKEAVDDYRKEGKACGVVTTHVLRPFPAKELAALCRNAKTVVVGDRQDSYGAGGGNLTLELKAALQSAGSHGAGVKPHLRPGRTGLLYGGRQGAAWTQGFSPGRPRLRHI